jgi:hypothetical protein
MLRTVSCCGIGLLVSFQLRSTKWAGYLQYASGVGGSRACGVIDRGRDAGYPAPRTEPDVQLYRVAQPLLAFAPTEPAVRRYRSGLFRKGPEAG